MGMNTCVAKWPSTWPNWRNGRAGASISSGGESIGSGGGGSDDSDGSGRSARVRASGLAAMDLDSAMLWMHGGSDVRCRFPARVSSASSLSTSLSP
jgi:hypothetical protein